jgi:glucuronoarabinoxylan endo-1,4-beta-xylanase
MSIRSALSRSGRVFHWRSALVVVCCLATGLLIAGCGSSDGNTTPTPTPTATPEPTPVPASTLTVTSAQRHQTISGFGASSAWHSTPPSDSEADKLFSPQSGAGLSLLRIRIAPDGDTVEMPTVNKALTYGVKVWAAPWSPPGEWKTSGTDVDGGRLLPQYYQSWADRLAHFVQRMASRGVTLAYLSAQNEPNWVASWETCEWTPAELTAFIRDNLGYSLMAHNLATPILAPEYNDWTHFADYADPLLDDPAAAAHLGVIAMHHYGGGQPYAYTAAAAKGKELWQTEMSVRVAGNGIASGLAVAQSMHDHLATASVNAWHYWWLTNADTTDPNALIQGGVVTKRLWVMGNYSRFIRPGSYRVAAATASGGSAQGVLTTAYRDPSAGTLVIVCVNPAAQVVRQPITLADLRVDAVTPWVTSESLDLVAQTQLTGGTTFSYDLPPQSVTTLVGHVQ